MTGPATGVGAGVDLPVQAMSLAGSSSSYLTEASDTRCPPEVPFSVKPQSASKQKLAPTFVTVELELRWTALPSTEPVTL